MSFVIVPHKLFFLHPTANGTPANPTLWQLSTTPFTPTSNSHVTVQCWPPFWEQLFLLNSLFRDTVIKSLQCPQCVSCTHRILVPLWPWERWQFWLSLHHHSFKYLVTTRTSTDVSTQLCLRALVLNNSPKVICRNKLKDLSELNLQMPKFWHLAFRYKIKTFYSADTFL